jgi:hypothetical protein
MRDMRDLREFGCICMKFNSVYTYRKGVAHSQCLRAATTIYSHQSSYLFPTLEEWFELEVALLRHIVLKFSICPTFLCNVFELQIAWFTYTIIALKRRA